jgi:hypothetical protein
MLGELGNDLKGKKLKQGEIETVFYFGEGKGEGEGYRVPGARYDGASFPRISFKRYLIADTKFQRIMFQRDLIPET